MNVTGKVSADGKTIHITWTPVPGCEGYLLLHNGVQVSRTFNPQASATNFAYAKGDVYTVEAIGPFTVIDKGSYSDAPTPPPSSRMWPITGAWDSPEGGGGGFTADWPAMKALGFNALFVGMNSGQVASLAADSAYAMVNAALYASDSQVQQYLPACWAVKRPDGKRAVEWVYCSDESSNVSAVAARSVLAKSICKNSDGSTVLTCASHFDSSTLAKIAQVVDVPVIDYYPCQYGNPQNIAYLRQCITACGAKPWIIAYQAFTDATVKGQSSHYRMPTAAELQAELDACKAALAGFAYCYGPAVPNQPTSLWMENQDGPTSTQDLVSVIKRSNGV